MMRSSDMFFLLSSAISIFLFIYFSTILVKINMYDTFGMAVSALAILMALLAQFMSVKERGLI